MTDVSNVFYFHFEGIEEDFISWRDGFRRDVFPALLGEKALVSEGCACSGGRGTCGADGEGCGKGHDKESGDQQCSSGKLTSSADHEVRVY